MPASAPGAGVKLGTCAAGLGANTNRKLRAVTGAKLTVVGTALTSKSATSFQARPSTLASTRGITRFAPPRLPAAPFDTKRVIDRTVCGVA
jgi:hypothetical protein